MSVAHLKSGALFAGRFRIERVIGRGGMGAVYSVVEASTERRFALKVLAPQLVSDPSHRARFSKEAAISANVASAHIVPVLEAGVDEQSDTPWILMELLLGESLGAFVRAHKRLDPKHAATVLGQIAEALEAAHAVDVVHRDLKPDNVFVVRTPDGSLDVRVLDFGIAKLTSDTIGRTTGALGSPLWMAPEETKKELLTPAVDVWAFGLLAFYVLTGRAIWRSADGDATIAQALSEVLLDPIPNPVLRAASVGVTLPKGFDTWFAGCVVREVSVRFQSIHDAWTQLEAILSAPPAPALPPPQRAPAPTTRLSNPVLAALVGVGTFSVLALVYSSVTGTPSVQKDAGPSAAQSSSVAEETIFAPPSATTPLALPPVPADEVDPVLAAVQSCLDKKDLGCARTALKRAIADGGAQTDQYVQLLYDLCELQRDNTCMATVKKQHPHVNKDPQRARMVAAPKDPISPEAGAEAEQRQIALQGLVNDATRWLDKNERSSLEPKVMSGVAAQSEADRLYDICNKQGDLTCCANVRQHYPSTRKHLAR